MKWSFSSEPIRDPFFKYLQFTASTNISWKQTKNNNEDVESGDEQKDSTD